MRNRTTLVMTFAVGLTSTVAMAQSPAGSSTFHPASQGAQLDLTKSFHTRSAWRLVVTEGPPVTGTILAVVTGLIGWAVIVVMKALTGLG